MRDMEVKADALAGLRVLIAEDEPLIALDLQEICSEFGAEVIGPCMTLKEALEAAARETISVAVLDVRLGQATTAEVAEMLDRRGIPVLFCSGQGLPDELRRRLPHAPALVKPVRYQRMIETIARLARR
jgi:CheY-like chemotaxis protein